MNSTRILSSVSILRTILSHTEGISCRRLRRCRRRPTRRLLRLPCRLCTHDAHAQKPRQWQGCSVSRGTLSPTAERHSRIVLTLQQGGYNLRSIARSALSVTRTLNGEAPPRMEDRKITGSCIDTVQKVAAHQSKYWNCLYPKKADEGRLIAVVV